MSNQAFEIINNIIQNIAKDQNIDFSIIDSIKLDEEWFDMALIKKLGGSNANSKGSVNSNQSSILLSGDELNIFPFIRRSSFDGKIIGKNITLKIDIKLMSNNMLYMNNENLDDSSINEVINSFLITNETTMKRIELGCKTLDDNNYVNLYESFVSGDYLIALKLSAKLEYIILGLKATDFEKYFDNIDDKNAIEYFGGVSKVTKNNKDKLTFINSSNYSYDNDESTVSNNGFNIFYNEVEIFSNLAMTDVPYYIVKHYIEQNENIDFKTLQETFECIDKCIFTKGNTKFILSNDEIERDSTTSKREANYITSNRPLLKLNSDNTEFGVYNQWYNSTSKKNFDKFIKGIQTLNYVVQESSSKAAVRGGINKIYFGAPGTGKSHYVDSQYALKNYKRVIFHPEYTYSDFVGYLKPRAKSEDTLTYEFAPGPFTSILLEALQNPSEPYTLIIEELNRANTASVFGDLFQLLDRDDNGKSIYPIYNNEVFGYINPKLDVAFKLEDELIHIPSNLSIIATMNTADQNVFIMDTAFKRRWEFEYIPIEFEESHKFKDNIISNLNISWKTFVTGINKFMMSGDNEDLMIAEDKQLGPYFAKCSDLENPKKFAYKVLLYLWEDVFKIDKYRLFNNEIRTFSALVTEFEKEEALNIFNANIRDTLFK